MFLCPRGYRSHGKSCRSSEITQAHSSVHRNETSLALHLITATIDR
jgi:hypothetical protein